MIIAVDYDDVIVDSARKITAYYNQQFDATVTLENFYSGNYKVDWNARDAHEAIDRVNGFLASEAYIGSRPDEQAIAVLTRLSADHELHVVSGRSHSVATATQSMIDRHLAGLFRSVVVTNFIAAGDVIKKGKGEVCREIGAELLIDDHLDHARDASDAGVQVLLFGDYPWNAADVLPPRVTRVADWSAVERYFYPEG